MDFQEISTKTCGTIKVFFQGVRTSKVNILTLHDLGCNHNEMVNFVSSDNMDQMRSRCFWIHVLIPGQGDGDDELPAKYTFPTMQQLAEAMGEVCDALELKQVILFGEGAGANILARLAMIREELVLGVVLIHCTGTTASLTETIRDKLICWKLSTVGMHPAAESYLILHRFGSVGSEENEYELAKTLSMFRGSLRDSINPKNLNKFILSFMARSKIIEKVDKLKCPTLFLTGALASHNHTVHRLYSALQNVARSDQDRFKKIELVEFNDVANVLRSKPDRVADCLQYFIQGLGLASSMINRRMSSDASQHSFRGRSMSMEEYDKPKGVTTYLFDKHRKYSTVLAGDISEQAE